MNDKKSISGLAVLFAVIGAILGSVLAQQFFFKSNSIDQALGEASKEINKTLPKMIDKETRLDTTMAVDGRIFIYRYTAVDVNAADIDKEKFVAAMRPELINNYRTKESMKRFRENGVTLRYQYMDSGGTNLAEISISPKDF